MDDGIDLESPPTSLFELDAPGFCGFLDQPPIEDDDDAIEDYDMSAEFGDDTKFDDKWWDENSVESEILAGFNFDNILADSEDDDDIEVLDD